MTAPLPRRERLARFARIGWIANLADRQLREAKPAPMPADMAERVQALGEAARAVAEMAEREIRFLEESPDWIGEGRAP